ncbi:MAG: PIN domain-containing protein [Desulfovermiculus sp.]|nr:PIN domain-containing protein [Desulfovermiculus sp.]
MKRIFLDANVIFTAAHNPDGKAALLLKLGKLGHWKLITSQLALEEARRNLTIKFPMCLSSLKNLQQDLQIVANSVQTSCPLELPAKDQPIFLAALQARATHLLTGDKAHFGVHMNKPSETQKIVIQTVGDFFKKLIEEEE